MFVMQVKDGRHMSPPKDETFSLLGTLGSQKSFSTDWTARLVTNSTEASKVVV